MRSRNDCRYFDLFRPYINDPNHEVFSLGQFEDGGIDTRGRAFDRDHIDRAGAQEGESAVIMMPIRIRCLPGQNLRNAIAVADMDRGLCVSPLGRGFERGDAPLLNRIEVDIKTRLIKLDDVTAVLGQLMRLVIEDGRQIRGEPPRLPVVLIRQGIRGGHRARKGDFHRLGRVLFEEA